MSEWISVNDKLPEHRRVVLTVSVQKIKDNTMQYVAWIDSYGIKNRPIWQYSWCCGCHPHSTITHWRELPEPPE